MLESKRKLIIIKLRDIVITVKASNRCSNSSKSMRYPCQICYLTVKC